MASDDGPVLGLFEGVGVEIEYMIVDRERLNVLPVCDQVLAAEAGEITTDVEFDDISWSNELVLHVIELKTTAPVADLTGLAEAFQTHVGRINKRLEPLGGMLLPTAMHPWMHPDRETKLWPHEYNAVYETFNRIFDCRGHGWSNLQSTHINLPFKGDEEFGRLHAAIRLLLPIMPALAASSPFVDGRATGILNNRMAMYKKNAARSQSISGDVIPEPVYTRDQYEEQILQRIYRDLAPHDPDGTLRYEWANARGAIARFDRSAIEIRVLDVQETPAADVAIVALIVEVLRALTDEAWCDLRTQQRFDTRELAAMLDDCIRDGEHAVISDTQYLHSLGVGGLGPLPAGDVWRSLLQAVRQRPNASPMVHSQSAEGILAVRPLARTLLHDEGDQGIQSGLHQRYLHLAHQLADGASAVSK